VIPRTEPAESTLVNEALVEIYSLLRAAALRSRAINVQGEPRETPEPTAAAQGQRE
jgi:hypothetical protein